MYYKPTNVIQYHNYFHVTVKLHCFVKVKRYIFETIVTIFSSPCTILKALSEDNYSFASADDYTIERR